MKIAVDTAFSHAIALDATEFSFANTFEVQYSSRADFAFAPSVRFTLASAANFRVEWLNKAATYFIRAREVQPGGGRLAWSNTVAARTIGVDGRDFTPGVVMIEPAFLVVPERNMEWETSPAALPGFPASNLGHPGPTAFRTTTAGTAFDLYFTLAGGPIDVFALLNTNLTEETTVRVYGADDPADLASIPSADFSEIYDFRASAGLPGRRGFHGLFLLPEPKTYRFWRLRVDTGTQPVPGGVVHVEHAIAGLNRVTKNHSVEKVEQPVDLGEFTTRRDGQPVIVDGMRQRRVDFDISAMTEADFEANYSDLWHRVGTTSPVLCVPNSKTGSFLHDRILYGPISGGRTVNPVSPRYTQAFTVNSLI